MLTLTDIILGNTNQYNGHKQLELEGVTFTLEQAISLVNDLQVALEDKEGYTGCVTLQVHGDYSASINACDYWKEGQHRMGHKDKLLVSIWLRGEVSDNE